MNILLIMCDSLPPQACGPYDDPTGATPNLDRLAKSGVTFGRAYCNSPLCTPSRASLCTGRYASQLGCFDNASGFASEWPTIGHCLGAAGYETTIIGKMHFVGHDQRHGFDQRMALDTDYTTGFNPRYYRLAYDWDQPVAGNPAGPDWMGPSYVQDERWDDFRQHYDRDATIHEAGLEYLDDKSPGDSPWFGCFSYHAPHNPFWIPTENRQRFENKQLPWPTRPPDGKTGVHGPMDAWLDAFHYRDLIDDKLLTEENLNWLYPTFYGMVFDLDRRVGQLLDRLEERGLTDETAVVFVSDHGDMMGHRGMIQKRYFYEPSVRVPMLMRVPGGASGRRVERAVSLIDLLPTFADWAGAELPSDLPGVSLSASAKDAVEPAVRTVFGEFHGEGVHAPCFFAVRQPLKLIYVHGHERRLYDLSVDPEEWHNCIGDPAYADAAAELEAELLETFDPERVARDAVRSQKNRGFLRRCYADAAAYGKAEAEA